MLEELISKVFAIRDCAHVAHWKTSSGFHHIVLGEFYGGVVDILDKLVEAYIGNFDDIGNVKTAGATLKGASDILTCLEKDVVWIASNCDGITGEVEALENILQELEGLYLSTIFKLKKLK